MYGLLVIARAPRTAERRQRKAAGTAERTKQRKGQALHGRVEADLANQCKIGSLSDLPFVVHADSKAPEKTAASAGPSQGDLSRSRWAAGVAPSRTRRVQRENERANGAGGLRVGNERWQ